MSSSSDRVRQRAEDACATMQAAVAALRDSRNTSCPVPSRQQVQAAVHLLRMEVAKLGLVYNEAGSGTASGTASGTGGPTDTEATSLLKGFEGAACTLYMLYTGLAATGGGPTLRQSLSQTATSVVEACVALIRWGAMRAQAWRGASHGSGLPLVGCCLLHACCHGAWLQPNSCQPGWGPSLASGQHESAVREQRAPRQFCWLAGACWHR